MTASRRTRGPVRAGWAVPFRFRTRAGPSAAFQRATVGAATSEAVPGPRRTTLTDAVRTTGTAVSTG